MIKNKIFLTSMLVVLFLIAVTPAMAKPVNTTHGTANGMGYTETSGILGGANYFVRIPDSWNGMLFVGCHGYYATHSDFMQYQFDSLGAYLISNGYAYAASDYGADGYSVKDGEIRTHQLTEYVIDNFGVSGKVFLFGGSMGGEIALLLGEKYPDLYSGVLDICGPKDLTSMYTQGALIASSSLSEIRTILGWPATVPDASVQAFKNFAIVSGEDLTAETGGTPTTKSQAYQRISPTEHADISIPMISLVGSADYTVPLSQTIEYQNAIKEAGQSSLYKMIVVSGGGHINAKTLSQAPAALTQLVVWSNTIDS